ncbi:MAG: hypothetical protein P4L84_30890 [Isosphaeraceae bacterium]|nr:hypothetical protein [Isosphaeraceae bacterium]
MNLLDRAKRLLQGQGPSVSHKTQYYNVLCPDGHRMSGARNEGYQALRCPSCGEGVFILPRSPLPDVAAPPRPAPQTARRHTADIAVFDEPIALSDPPPLPPRDANEEYGEIEWEESPAPENTRRAPAAAEPEDAAATPHGRQQARPDGRAGEPRQQPATPPQPREVPQPRRPKPRPAPAPAPPAPQRPDEPEFDLRDWARRRRNPLIFTVVGLVLVATVGFRQWRSQMQDYPRQAELGRTEGLKALDAGEWDKAHLLLSKAKRAVDALGGKVEGAEEIRHGADEANLYANRVSESLETLLKEADPSDTSDWPRQFETLYKGKAIIVRAEVTAVPEADGTGSYDLDYRILPNGEGDLDRRRDLRIGRFDLSRFRLMHDLQPKRGTQLAFGARLSSFTFDPERNEWLVGLEPDSGVILRHQKALANAMMTADAESAPEEGKP